MIGNTLGPVDRTVSVLIDRSYPVVKAVYLHLKEISTVYDYKDSVIFVSEHVEEIQNVQEAADMVKDVHKNLDTILGAEDNATKAETAAQEAEDYSALAKRWAIETQTPVEGELYGSKYYAEQSALVKTAVDTAHEDIIERQATIEQIASDMEALGQAVVTVADNIEDVNTTADNITYINTIANDFTGSTSPVTMPDWGEVGVDTPLPEVITGGSIYTVAMNINHVLTDSVNIEHIVRVSQNLNNLLFDIEALQGMFPQIKEDAEATLEARDEAVQSAQTATDQATLAQASAEEAKKQANAALTSANDAWTYRDQAKTYADTARSFATTAQSASSTALTAQEAAETAQAEAQKSATAASESATAASNSATAAKASQTAAETAKAGAESAKTAAETQASNASESAESASTSASAATNSAAQAKASQTAAKTSETNAKTSETNAKASETAAAQSASEANSAQTTASSQCQLAEQAATKAEAAKTAAEAIQDDFEGALTALQNPTVSVQTLTPGSQATATITPNEGSIAIALGIPQGLKGDVGDQGPQGKQGIQGPKGEPGNGLTIKGTYASLSALQSAHATGSEGDVYATTDTTPPTVYIWDTVANAWTSIGAVQGAKGDTGAEGPQGPTGVTPAISISVTGLAAGASPTVVKSGTAEAPSFAIGIPKGDKGDKGDQGPQGVPGTTTWDGLTGVPSTFTPSAHTHATSEVMGLDTALASKQPTGDYATNTALMQGLAGKANTSHTHTVGQITDFDPNKYVLKRLDIPSNGSTSTSIQVTGTNGSEPVLTNIGTEISSWEPLLTFLSRKGTSEYTQIVMGHDDVTFSIGSSKRIYLSTLINIPSTYATQASLTSGLAGKANTSHTHTQDQITGLTATLNGKANATHNHTVSQITDLSTTLSAYRLKSEPLKWSELADLGEVGV